MLMQPANKIRPGGAQRLPMRRPLLALAGALALGIWLQELCRGPVVPAWAVVGLGTVLLLFLAWRAVGGPLRFFGWLLVFLAIGFARGPRPVSPGAPAVEDQVVVYGVAQSSWEVRTDNRRLVLDTFWLREAGQIQRPSTQLPCLTSSPSAYLHQDQHLRQ